jgi:hypothetical protein
MSRLNDRDDLKAWAALLEDPRSFVMGTDPDLANNHLIVIGYELPTGMGVTIGGIYRIPPE